MLACCADSTMPDAMTRDTRQERIIIAFYLFVIVLSATILTWLRTHIIGDFGPRGKRLPPVLARTFFRRNFQLGVIARQYYRFRNGWKSPKIREL